MKCCKVIKLGLGKNRAHHAAWPDRRHETFLNPLRMLIMLDLVDALTRELFAVANLNVNLRYTSSRQDATATYRPQSTAGWNVCRSRCGQAILRTGWPGSRPCRRGLERIRGCRCRSVGGGWSSRRRWSTRRGGGSRRWCSWRWRRHRCHRRRRPHGAVSAASSPAHRCSPPRLLRPPTTTPTDRDCLMR